MLFKKSNTSSKSPESFRLLYFKPNSNRSCINGIIEDFLTWSQGFFSNISHCCCCCVTWFPAMIHGMLAYVDTLCRCILRTKVIWFWYQTTLRFPYIFKFPFLLPTTIYIFNINSLPNDRILDLSELKTSADDQKKKVTEKLKFILGRVKKIVRKGEMLVSRIFCFFPQCFQKVSFSGLLTHYQTTNFRLFQTERVCRRQFQIWRKWQKVTQKGRKHCGKRRNCSLRAISPFPTVFS